jgi:hypothetical protein
MDTLPAGTTTMIICPANSGIPRNGNHHIQTINIVELIFSLNDDGSFINDEDIETQFERFFKVQVLCWIPMNCKITIMANSGVFYRTLTPDEFTEVDWIIKDGELHMFAQPVSLSTLKVNILIEATDMASATNDLRDVARAIKFDN